MCVRRKYEIHHIEGNTKNLPFPLFRREIKGEVEQKKQVFGDAFENRNHTHQLNKSE